MKKGLSNKLNNLDYEETYIVKGCTKIETQGLYIALKNSFKEECSLEFESEISCNEWKEMI